MSLTDFLADLDARWNPTERLVTAVITTPGYHTKLRDGSKAHWTREAMDYALACLQSGEPHRVQRAELILARILSLQVRGTTNTHFGIWGWFAEEPPPQMAPADWNWADFIGARIAQALIAHGHLLSEPLKADLRDALHRACLSIFRRNVGPSYTNIAVMGGVVCAAGGEALSEPLLLEYGRDRLADVVAFVHKCGGFTEYNSPTYTRVVLEETERALLLVRDPAVRASAECLRRSAWETLADHFHPATGQIAGPHSRAYADRLTPALARYFHEQAGAPTHRASEPPGIGSGAIGGALYDVVPPLPCPPDIAARFRQLPSDPLEVRSRFGETEHGPTVGTTWFTRNACIGSVSRGLAWVQQRPILGYWHTAADPSICLRVRVLKDGRDFASTYYWTDQRGPRLLTAASLISHSGDHHPILDRPADGIFSLSDLRLRIELTGKGVHAEQTAPHLITLSAGDWKAVVHTHPARFDDRDVAWSVHQSDAIVGAEAVLHTGSPRKLDSNTTPLRLAWALEILRASQSPSNHPLTSRPQDNALVWSWNDLTTKSPTRPIKFGW